MSALNPKYNSLVKRFLKHNAKYDYYVDTEQDHLRAADMAYTNACDIWDELPKREQANLVKQNPELKGAY